MSNIYDFINEKKHQFVLTDTPSDTVNEILATNEIDSKYNVVVSLPNFSIPRQNNPLAVKPLAAEIFDLIMAKSIIESCINELDGSKQVAVLLNEFNNVFLNPSYYTITNIDGILNAINESIEMYYNALNRPSADVSMAGFQNIPVAFIDINVLIKIIQEVTNKDCNFTLLINGDNRYGQIETMLINSIMTDEYNDSLFVKAIIDNSSWTTIQDVSNNPVLNYEIIRLSKRENNTQRVLKDNN